MSRVSRKEDEFYGMLRTLCNDVLEVVKVYDEIAKGWPESKSRIPEVSQLEIICDGHENELLDALNVSFITPFDREDLNALACELGEIADSAESVAARFELFDVHEMIPEAANMTELILNAMQELSVLFDHFADFKKDPIVREQAKKVVAIEDEGDVVHRTALGRIFNSPDDPIHVIKWKSMLDAMENTLDMCQEVSNTVLAVIMKNA